MHSPYSCSCHIASTQSHITLTSCRRASWCVYSASLRLMRASFQSFASGADCGMRNLHSLPPQEHFPPLSFPEAHCPFSFWLTKKGIWAFDHSEAAVHSMISLSNDTVHQSTPGSLSFPPRQICRPECPYVQVSHSRHEPWLCVTRVADCTAIHFSTCLPFASFEDFSFESITSMLSVELTMLAPSSSPRLTTRSLSFGTVNIT